MKKHVYEIEPDNYYHIYNRGIDGCKIFFDEKNYDYFLKLFKEKILPIAEIYSYCLLPNHFHFMVKIKSENEIRKVFHEKKEVLISKIISQQFSNTFNSYSQAINKKYSRTGKLFELPFRRKIITSDEYLINGILYIHNNPIKHHLNFNIYDFKFSSLHSIINGNDDLISTKEIIALFDNIENLKERHNNFSFS